MKFNCFLSKVVFDPPPHTHTHTHKLFALNTYINSIELFIAIV